MSIHPSKLRDADARVAQGSVHLMFDQNQLEGLGLPSTQLMHNRYLLSVVNGAEVAVGAFAIPPKNPSQSAFWPGFIEKVKHFVKSEEPIPIARLKIEPRINIADAERTIHAPISVTHPYVVMEDGTQYGIAVFIPTQWIGQWSEIKERDASGGSLQFMKTSKEKYRERENVVLLVRLNGETPIAEFRTEIETSQPIREEMPIPVSEKKVDGKDYSVTYIHKQAVVTEKSIREMQVGDEEKNKAALSDLVFHVVADRGSEENADVNNDGLVEVIVGRCIDDEVVERSHSIFPVIDMGDISSTISMGGMKSITRSPLPDSTLQGKTSLENTSVEKVTIRSIRGFTPIARFQFGLVGSGGPVTAIMTEAPEVAT